MAANEQAEELVDSLILACALNRPDDARLSLDRGAAVNGTDRDGRTTLYYASSNGCLDVARLCIERGADIDRSADGGRTPLYVACREGREHVVRLLLDNGAAVDRACVERRTPLHIACREGREQVVRLLLGRCDVDPTDENGRTPLHDTCWDGHYDVARLCLEHGAELARSDNHGLTPYKIAHGCGRLGMAAWLARIRKADWTRHLSEPRYKLVVLRALAVRGLAQRQEGALDGNERLWDFLFPGYAPPPQAKKRKRQARLPDELFAIIACYYWGGGLSAEEEDAAAAERQARAAAAEAFESESEEPAGGEP